MVKVLNSGIVPGFRDCIGRLWRPSRESFLCTSHVSPYRSLCILLEGETLSRDLKKDRLFWILKKGWPARNAHPKRKLSDFGRGSGNTDFLSIYKTFGLGGRKVIGGREPQRMHTIIVSQLHISSQSIYIVHISSKHQ